MSDNLDDKLRDILTDVRNEYDVSDDVIAQIKQAFVQAGYIKLSVKPGDFITVNAGTAKLNGDGTVTEVKRMTGAAWYQNLEAAINQAGITFQPGDSGSRVVYEALKLTGLNQTKENN